MKLILIIIEIGNHKYMYIYNERNKLTQNTLRNREQNRSIGHQTQCETNS